MTRVDDIFFFGFPTEAINFDCRYKYAHDLYDEIISGV